MRLATAIILSLIACWGVRGVAVEIPPEMQLTALPARPPDPPENRSTPVKVKLGRILFFDPILSGNQEVACATCHSPRYGWADGRATPIGIGGEGEGPTRRPRSAMKMRPPVRNAPSLLNVGFNGLVTGRALHPNSAPMFWDGRKEGLEQQVFVPMKTREEMRGDGCPETAAVEEAIHRIAAVPRYRELFGAAFEDWPQRVVTAERLAKAIAAFERTLVAADSPFDRYLRGDETALNPSAKSGLAAFQRAGCIRCHGGPMLSDFKLHFIGAGGSGPDAAREIRTPTLRNLASTGPYMHDGSQKTIRDVLVFYEALSDAVSETLDGGDETTQPRLDPLLKHLDLRTEDFPAIEAFLAALNDDGYDRSEPAEVPSGLKRR